MQTTQLYHRNEEGQTALEAAIILIAFIVVAAVFAFAILSAGSASTERGQEAIYSGLDTVQSSMQVKGTVIGEGDTTATPKAVKYVRFTVASVSKGKPVDLTAPSTLTGTTWADETTPANKVTIGYRDQTQYNPNLKWAVKFIGANDGDALLEEGELAEITVKLSGLTTQLQVNTQFTLEIKPPTGSVIGLTRTTPATIETVMELR